VRDRWRQGAGGGSYPEAPSRVSGLPNLLTDHTCLCVAAATAALLVPAMATANTASLQMSLLWLLAAAGNDARVELFTPGYCRMACIAIITHCVEACSYKWHHSSCLQDRQGKQGRHDNKQGRVGRPPCLHSGRGTSCHQMTQGRRHRGGGLMRSLQHAHALATLRCVCGSLAGA
jgi:hypothetical protein